MNQQRAAPSEGLAYGIGAYLFWGLIPVYWRLLREVSPAQLLAHRVIWGLVFFAAFAIARGRGPEIRVAFRDRRVRITLLVSAALLASNWLVFIYAINNGKVLQASLGYFINPLLSVLIGMLVLGERLRRLQWLALGLATIGVVRYAVVVGGLPWISLYLAASFGIYGLLRKRVRVDALPGSTLEILFMVPLALAYLTYLVVRGDGVLGNAGIGVHLLLVGTGLITMLPLLWFTNAARRLPLSTLGFLQYLAPTGQFILAVVIYEEAFPSAAFVGFAIIWTGLAVFSIDVGLSRRRHKSG